MEILLFRHGQTPGNARNRYIGTTDEPLSPAGRAALGPYTGPVQAQFVYTTPLRRTGETAALLFPGLPQRPLAGLAEMDFGAFEGRSAAEMAGDPAYRAWVAGNCLAPTPGGEDMASFARRCAADFEPAVEAALAEGLPQLIFVAHGGTLMALMSLYARPRQSFFGCIPGNGRGWRLLVEPDLWRAEKGLRLAGEIGGAGVLAEFPTGDSSGKSSPAGSAGAPAENGPAQAPGAGEDTP